MVGFEATIIGHAATRFVMDVFEFPEACQTELEKLVTLRLVPRWMLDSPRSGSCRRALLFPHGKVDPDFEAVCEKLRLSGALVKGRKQFPHEFTLFQDPDGCEAEFSWGMRCREMDTVSVYPKNDWESYSQHALKRKVKNCSIITSKKLDTFTVAGSDLIWNESAVNIPDQLSSSDSESIKSSPSVSRGPSPDAEKLFLPAQVRSYSPLARNLNATSPVHFMGRRPVLGATQSAVMSSQDTFSQSTIYSSSPLASQRLSPQQLYPAQQSSTPSLSAMSRSYTTAASLPMSTVTGQPLPSLPGSMYVSSGSSFAAGASLSSAPTYASSIPQYSGSAFVDNMFYQSNDISLAGPTYRDMNSAVPLMA